MPEEEWRVLEVYTEMLCFAFNDSCQTVGSDFNYLAILDSAQAFREIWKTSQNVAECDQPFRIALKDFLNSIDTVLQDSGYL